jgi:cobalamin-dependent methionine synthase I
MKLSKENYLKHKSEVLSRTLTEEQRLQMANEVKAEKAEKRKQMAKRKAANKKAKFLQNRDKHKLSLFGSGKFKQSGINW